jgi:hypothetical protein
MRMYKTLALIEMLSAASASARTCEPEAFNSKKLVESGYSLVFGSRGFTSESVDLKGTGKPGYDWYLTKFFGYTQEPPENITLLDGMATLSPTTSDGGWSLASAAPSTNANGYVGNVFGGPAKAYYIEAQIGFDQTIGQRIGSEGYPSFWALSIEHMTGKMADQWPGQSPGFEHFFEDDFFEYDTYNPIYPSNFGSKRWDWYGEYNITCPGFCSKSNEMFGVGSSDPSVYSIFSWSSFHTVGQLWLLGTDANGYQGSMTTYLDNIPCLPGGTACGGYPVTWKDSTTMAAPPPTETDIYSIVDQSRLNLILGTAPNWPMTVKYVHVWRCPL